MAREESLLVADSQAPPECIRSSLLSAYFADRPCAPAGLRSWFQPMPLLVLILFLGLESGRLDCRRPQFGVVFHDFGENFGRSSCRLQAERQHAVLELRRMHCVNDRFVKSLGDVRWRLRRSKHAVPSRCREIVAGFV